MRGLPSLRALDAEAAGGPRARIWLPREAQDMRCGFDRLVKHARYYWLLLAESHLTRRLFGSMMRRVEAPPVRPE
jgi:hypothetical protein